MLVGYENPAGSPGSRSIGGESHSAPHVSRLRHGMAHAVPEGSTTSVCGVLHLRFGTGRQEWPPRSFNVPQCPVCRQKAKALRDEDEN